MAKTISSILLWIIDLLLSETWLDQVWAKTPKRPKHRNAPKIQKCPNVETPKNAKLSKNAEKPKNAETPKNAEMPKNAESPQNAKSPKNNHQVYLLGLVDLSSRPLTVQVVSVLALNSDSLSLTPILKCTVFMLSKITVKKLSSYNL